MPEPTQEEIVRAEAILRTIPEYQALIAYGEDPKSSKLLGPGGASKLSGLSEHAIRKYADEGRLHGAINYPDLGWRIPYSALVTFIAQVYRQSQAG
jgi:hypothetical protein